MSSYYPSITELAVLSPTATVDAMYQALHAVEEHKLAALAVPPFWTKKLRRDMGQAHAAELVAVVGSPYGYQRTEAKQLEAELALKDGASAIELTLNVSAWQSASAGWIKIETVKLAKYLHDQEKPLTVRLELHQIAEPTLPKLLKTLSDAGADYVKVLLNDAGTLLSATTRLRELLPQVTGLKIGTSTLSGVSPDTLEKAGAERIELPFPH
ncbi:deoxyribose-phosphate aldolase [Telluribacter sp. SYSU D00476]|uniref:deoxyribose-phosphate aldolase n=1 Tax=Telluribacter sp. SYSU D00476 TaxID=2811430 RepID=UPI001FF11797|nr:deoxyribose-phosphate aldolase [Telluribacter sp. SYSU D00476]